MCIRDRCMGNIRASKHQLCVCSHSFLMPRQQCCAQFNLIMYCGQVYYRCICHPSWDACKWRSKRRLNFFFLTCITKWKDKRKFGRRLRFGRGLVTGLTTRFITRLITWLLTRLTTRLITWLITRLTTRLITSLISCKSRLTTRLIIWLVTRLTTRLIIRLTTRLNYNLTYN